MPPVPPSAPSVAPSVGVAVGDSVAPSVAPSVGLAVSVGDAVSLGSALVESSGSRNGGRFLPVAFLVGLCGRGRRRRSRVARQQHAAAGRGRRRGLAGPALGRSGRRRGRAEPALGHHAEAQLRLPLDRVDEVAAAGAGDLDDDVLVALRGHLGLGDTGAVHPVVDDVGGLAERLGGDVVAGGGQADPGAALEVQAERRLPRAGQRHEPVEDHGGEEEDRQGARRAGGTASHVSAPRSWCRGRARRRTRPARSSTTPRAVRPSGPRHHG